MEQIGFSWHTDPDNTPYIANEIVQITPKEADAYYEAVNELYDMFVEAGDILYNNMLHEIGVPFIYWCCKMSWENDVHWHLYGRFDLAGGIDGSYKAFGVNADHQIALLETSILTVGNT